MSSALVRGGAGLLPSGRALTPVVLLGLTLTLAAGAEAQSLSVSGDPSTLIVQSAAAGSQPDPDLDSSTTYDVTVLATSKIVGRVDAALPSGVDVKIELEAPAGAVSHGKVTLTTSDQDLVTDIASGSYSGLAITYELTATVDAGVVALDDRTVTLTVANN